MGDAYELYSEWDDPGTTGIAEAQEQAWFDRHEALGTDSNRDAYRYLAYRRADHEAALIENEARDNGRLPQVLDVYDWIGPEQTTGVVIDVEPGDVSVRWYNSDTHMAGWDHPTLGEFPSLWRKKATVDNPTEGEMR